jgi:hypothetical protein
MTAPARYRRPARRTRRRRTHPAGVIGVVAVLAWGGDALYRLVAVHAEASIAAVVLAVVAAGLAAGVRWQLSRRREQVRIHRTHALDEILALDSTSFEFFTADLLRRDGCTRVRRVGGAGDLAADNLARLPDGRKLLVQDKFYAQGTCRRSAGLGRRSTMPTLRLSSPRPTSRAPPPTTAAGRGS